MPTQDAARAARLSDFAGTAHGLALLHDPTLTSPASGWTMIKCFGWAEVIVMIYDYHRKMASSMMGA
jgi:hypothetical protein